MTDERVTGKVASVVNARELIINRGSAQGVDVGMIFKVLDPSVSAITDPDTGEPLGEIKRIRVLVKVVNVGEKFAVARTYRQQRVNVGGFDANPLGRMFNPPKYKYLTETLKLDPTEEVLAITDSIVTVGDPVESLLDGEDEDDVPSTTVWQ